MEAVAWSSTARAHCRARQSGTLWLTGRGTLVLAAAVERRATRLRRPGHRKRDPPVNTCWFAGSSVLPRSVTNPRRVQR